MIAGAKRCLCQRDLGAHVGVNHKNHEQLNTRAYLLRPSRVYRCVVRPSTSLPLPTSSLAPRSCRHQPLAFSSLVRSILMPTFYHPQRLALRSPTLLFLPNYSFLPRDSFAQSMRLDIYSHLAIAQLAEHLTVEHAAIRWSLVRFRVAGIASLPLGSTHLSLIHI